MKVGQCNLFEIHLLSQFKVYSDSAQHNPETWHYLGKKIEGKLYKCFNTP